MGAPPILDIKIFSDTLIRLSMLEQKASPENLGERLADFEALVWMFASALKAGDDLRAEVEFLRRKELNREL